MWFFEYSEMWALLNDIDITSLHVRSVDAILSKDFRLFLSAC